MTPPRSQPAAAAANDVATVEALALAHASLPIAAPSSSLEERAAELDPDVAPAPSAPQANGALPAHASPELWRALQNAIRTRVQPEQFETWFRRALLVHADATVVRLAVQNAFARDWLVSYYRDVLDQAVHQVFGSARRIEFVLDPELSTRFGRDTVVPGAPDSSGPGGLGASSSDPRRGANGAPLDRGDRGDRDRAGLAPATQRDAAPSPFTNGRFESATGLLWSSDVNLNPKYTFENFVVGPCNRFAHAAAVGVSEVPGKNYNPFFLHGNVGLGKTHLLQSLCFALLERNPKTRILYLSCETFVNHFINALENGDLAKFRHKYRNVDLLVVDDIHLLANKERTQEEFFHTFNSLYQSGKQIVLSSDSPPKDIPTLQERLVSRFKWGLVTEIEPPCYETRMAILKRKSRDRGRELPDDVARLLAERVESNIRELEGAVVKLMGYSSLAGQPVTVELAREALRDLFEQRKGAPSMEEILGLVTEHFGVKLSELQSKKRTNAVAYPRQIAMYVARQVTRHSLGEIGGYFGGRDHSTVIYGIDKVGQLVQSDESVREVVDGFIQRLQAPSR